MRINERISKNVIALIMLGGPSVAWFIGSIVDSYVPLVNYREMSVFGGWEPATVTLYAVGIYLASLTIQLMPRRIATLEPALLTLGGTIGLIAGASGIILLLRLSSSLTQFMFNVLRGLLALPAVLFIGGLSFGGMVLASRLQRSRSQPSFKFIILGLRSIVPVILMVMLIWMHFGSFPVLATAKVRQEWASNNFDYYQHMVQHISSCSSIQERVGSVKFVAPTFGQNYIVSDEGSSAHRGALTLEVIGTQSIGVFSTEFRYGTDISSGRFTYLNKSETVKCPYTQ